MAFRTLLSLCLLFPVLIAFGRAEDRCDIRAFVGITHTSPNSMKLDRLGYDVRGGAYVTTVVGCSGAYQAGIMPMDYLIGVNGKEASNSQEFFCLLKDFRPGESVKVTLLRNGKRMTVDLTLGKREDACHEETPYPSRGFFGINSGDTDSRPGVVVDVSSNGPVSALGIQDGDRILTINGYKVADWDDISTVKRLITDINNVDFELLRGQQRLTISGAIGESQSHSWNNLSWPEVAVYNNNDCNEIDIDLSEVERTIENAINSIDLEEVEREAQGVLQQTMTALEEALESIRGGRRTTDDDTWNEVDASDMDAKIEEATSGDMDRLRSNNIDLPTGGELVLRNFTASPNPNRGIFRLGFELPQQGATSVSIYSSVGREVYAFDLGDFTGAFNDELDIMRNGPGTYFLVVRQGSKMFARKIIFVQR